MTFISCTRPEPLPSSCAPSFFRTRSSVRASVTFSLISTSRGIETSTKVRRSFVRSLTFDSIANERSSSWQRDSERVAPKPGRLPAVNSFARRMNSKAKAAAETHFISAAELHAEALRPPLARREPVETVLHGDRRVDHYYWLRKKESPEVIAYLEAENAYTDAILRPTEKLQDELYQEMLRRIQQTDMTVPYRLRGYQYFSATEQGKQYPIHCRRLDTPGSLDEVLLDMNQLAEGH